MKLRSVEMMAVVIAILALSSGAVAAIDFGKLPWRWTQIDLNHPERSLSYKDAKLVGRGRSLTIVLSSGTELNDSVLTCERDDSDLICLDDSGASFAGSIRNGQYEVCTGGKSSGTFSEIRGNCEDLEEPVRTFILLHNENRLLFVSDR